VVAPLVPVTVMLYVPVAVDGSTVIVIFDVPAPVMEVGLKATVTPVGWPLADNVTAELKPPETVEVIVDFPDLPRTTDTELGEAERLKPGGVPVTVRETMVVWMVLPAVPVTVMGYVPGTADKATVMVIVDVPAPFMEAGLKPTVTPVGWPVADNLTAELKPPKTVEVIVDVPELPCATGSELGEAERLKPVTVRETVVVWVVPLAVPVTVMGYVPGTVDVDTVMVIVDVPAPFMEVGLKPTVTPDGWPIADNTTAVLKPLKTVEVIVDVPELPCATGTELGEAERLKPVTVSETVVVWMVLPAVPVTVTMYVPVTVDGSTVMVIVDVPVPVMEVGLNPTVTPVGWPLADNTTAVLKPPEMVEVIVVVPALPRATGTELGEAERLKPGGGALPVSALIRAAPLGLPQPVVKS